MLKEVDSAGPLLPWREGIPASKGMFPLRFSRGLRSRLPDRDFGSNNRV
jgi:hypothetical protein